MDGREHYRSSIVLTSLLHMVKSGFTFPRQEQWTAKLLESLLIHLDYLPIFECSAPLQIIAHAPILAEILLHFLTGIHCNRSTSAIERGACSALASRLEEFTNAIVKLDSLEALSHSSSPKSFMFSSSHGSLTSFIDPKASYIDPLDNKLVLKQQPHKSSLIFEIGEKVDGLCVMANGSQRWFPGRVEEGKNNRILDLTEFVCILIYTPAIVI